ncbi:CHAT domain-containing protein [Streptomyces sp. NPDC085460]|uniref:CHAT domain-containing protein n=1 Tax=Streptomyces sp. NPDC085460 TaxID=3365723 RepID=UPI0037D561BD
MACHSSQDCGEPSRAGLYLHDGVLTVAELATVRTEGPGERAYLSACATATGGVDAPDEAITLAHALQTTGYRQVVATLWSGLLHPDTWAPEPARCQSRAFTSAEAAPVGFSWTQPAVLGAPSSLRRKSM